MLNKFAAPIDYLVIGHIASDLLPDRSITLGGTAAYAALTAHALQKKPGILTALGPETPLDQIRAIPIAGVNADRSTTFENIPTPTGRLQRVHHVAPLLHPYMVPEVWRSASIVHFAPLLDEVDFDIFQLFRDSFIGMTPQGWLRSVRPDGRVVPTDWLEASFVLRRADAVVMSIEDVGFEENLIDQFAELSEILVVTEGAAGCRLYQRGQMSRFPAPEEIETESTGAGDIFAAVFFIIMQRTGDPEKAAEIAVRLASYSVQRPFLKGVPTESEIYQTFLEIPIVEGVSFPP